MRADFEFSPPQWEAISAPLEPAVVIAGAGSGKTSVMAARVVYLVATGQVAPDQVLGLTFTTKATAELAARVRASLAAAGLDGPVAGGEPDELPERVEPVVSTYNAYAASLLTEHGLRIGHEPDTRVMADASRYQVAARAIERHTGPVELLSEHPKFAIDYLLALDGEMNEHLVSIEQVRAWQAQQRPLFEAALATSRAKTEITKVLDKMSEREEILDLVEGYRRLKAQFGLMDFSDQIALAAELARLQPEVGRVERGSTAWCCWTSTRTPPSRRPSCSAPSSPGRPARKDEDTRSRQSAIPTRRSTAGGVPRSPTSSTSPTSSRPVRARRSRRTRSR